MKDYANRPGIIDFFEARDNNIKSDNVNPVHPSRNSSYIGRQSTASVGDSMVFAQYPAGDDDVFMNTPTPSLAKENEPDNWSRVTGKSYYWE